MPVISSNPTLLSPIPPNVVKQKKIEPVLEPKKSPVHIIKPITPSKTEISVNVKTEIPPETIWVKIELNKLNIKTIPALRKHFETTRPWLLEPKIPNKISPKGLLGKIEESTREDKHTNFGSKAKIMKENINEISKEIIKIDNVKEEKVDIAKEIRNDVKKPPSSEESHRDRKHKSKKRKRRNSSSSISSHSTISNLSQNSKHTKHILKEVEDSKSKRRKDDVESRSHTENLNLTTTPPTNHERLSNERETSRIQGNRSSDPTLSRSKPRNSRQYRSYFEPPDEPPDLKKRFVDLTLE